MAKIQLRKFTFEIFYFCATKVLAKQARLLWATLFFTFQQQHLIVQQIYYLHDPVLLKSRVSNFCTIYQCDAIFC